MNENTKLVQQWAIESKIIEKIGTGIIFTKSFINIFNSNLKYDNPDDALVKTIKAYCYEKSDTEQVLLDTYVCMMLSSYDNPLGNYFKKVDEDFINNSYNNLDEHTIPNCVNDAVNKVKTEKDGV